KTKEIIQLVFLKLWTTKSSYQSEKGHFVNWLLTITRHICVDYIRKEQVHSKRQYVVDPASQNKFPDSYNEIETSLVRNELSAAKSKLSSAQSRLIDLLYWKGYS